MRILGLDEAGRGSVLGPLVMGAYAFETDDPDRAWTILRAAGADDSKALSAKRRDAARSALSALGTGDVRIVTPAQIEAGNLNTLEEDAFVALVATHRPDAVWLDAPVHPRGIPAVRARLVARTGVRTWVIEPKADATYPVVGAASIWAKTTRDAAIAALGPEVGSGYPSDPVTRAWLLARLREDAPLPDCVRTRWETIERLRQGSLFGG